MQKSNFRNSGGNIACNKVVLKQLREKRGLTQADLARLAGYSERLIVKAEAGRSISRRTIEDIAEALGTPTEPIYPEDLTSEPVELARKYMEALYVHQKNAIDHIRHFLDEDIIFKIDGNPEEIPFAGVHRGIDGVARAFELFFSVLEVPAGHDHTQWYQYFAQGADAVVWGQSWIQPIGHPLKSPMNMSHLMQFRKGKMYLFDDHYDTQMTASILKEAHQEPDLPHNKPKWT